MVETTLTFPQKDVDALFAQMWRAERKLNKSLPNTMAWAGKLVAASLSASTRKSPKFRRVIKNPKYDGDQRLARYGVMKLRQDKPPKFIPIAGTGEYGKIRFISRTTGKILTRDRTTGEVTALPLDFGSNQKKSLGVMGHRKRKIGKSGLAKLAWRAAGTQIISGGSRNGMGVSRIAIVRWDGKRSLSPTLTLTNNLRYADVAWNNPSGSGAVVESTMERAARNMETRISKQLEKRLSRIR